MLQVKLRAVAAAKEQETAKRKANCKVYRRLQNESPKGLPEGGINPRVADGHRRAEDLVYAMARIVERHLDASLEAHPQTASDGVWISELSDSLCRFGHPAMGREAVAIPHLPT